MKEELKDITKTPLPLKALLKENDVRLWQVVRRMASFGFRTTEPRLSRILNGIDQSGEKEGELLLKIEKELQERSKKEGIE